MASYRGLPAEHNYELPGLTIALNEARRGRFVVPGAPFAKVPHPDVSSWSEWATCNPREIRRNWPEGGANVIVACKLSGLLIIDPDRHEHDGVAAFTRLCKEHEPDGDWPDTHTVQTPTDGLHFYFTNPGGRYGNGRGALPKGIDVRGGGTNDGGYVLAAGSVVDRRAYKDPELQAIVGDGKAYQVYNDAPVLALPPWLAVLLERTARPPGTSTSDTDATGIWFTANLTDAQLEDHLERTISRMLTEPEGKRNDLLYWAAKRFGRAVALGRFDYQAAWDELENAGHQAGLDADEIPASIKSGFRKVGA